MKLSKMVWVSCSLVLSVFMSCASSPAKTTTAAKGGVPENTTVLRQSIIDEAEKHIGKPYSSPPNVPSTFDCSGFVNHIFTKTANMPLSPSTKAYLNLGREIDFKEAKPGDVLVFASQPGGSNVDHIAILHKKSANGELRGSHLIHAVSIPIQSATIKGDPNTAGVVIGELGKRGDGKWQNEYFLSRYICTRRFID
ncbi:hypothetical protein FACS1894190_05010 [Spirochaetia bacterium]|nr:hypothetical protein FACS1894190_05010 [Spirochaetia bacterium]